MTQPRVNKSVAEHLNGILRSKTRERAQPHAAAGDSTDADTGQETPHLRSLTDVKHRKGKKPVSWWNHNSGRPRGGPEPGPCLVTRILKTENGELREGMRASSPFSTYLALCTSCICLSLSCLLLDKGIFWLFIF